MAERREAVDRVSLAAQSGAQAFRLSCREGPELVPDHVKNLQPAGRGCGETTRRCRKRGHPGLKSKRLGNRVLPYSMFAFMAPGMPECDFYWREWYNPLGFSSLGQGLYKYAAVRPVPS
ncbi:MAG: hypothetical protein CM1200mP2_27050 [Planctomycetaceae bacterium]|nr:MAG: hypothetical protein CM1200mP2_27050 [Planctomycetaceae bacterium]